MPRQKRMSREDLVALFASKATEPPAEANKMLARHLQCKKSMKLADAVKDAVDRYPGNDPLLLPAPSSILPPLL